MKKKISKLSVIALLLSTAVFTACSAPVSTNATNTTESQTTTEERSNSAKGAFNGKDIEAFADPIFAQKMMEYNVNGSNFVVVKDGKELVNKGYGYADKEKKTLVVVKQRNHSTSRELTSDNRGTAFIIDDSMFERNRSKSVQMLARFF